jgi:hypothetical protein
MGIQESEPKVPGFGLPQKGVLESWRIGVLGLKAEMDLIFTLLPLIIRDPNMVCVFPLYQTFINPLLQCSGSILSVRLRWINCDLALMTRISILDIDLSFST